MIITGIKFESIQLKKYIKMIQYGSIYHILSWQPLAQCRFFGIVTRRWMLVIKDTGVRRLRIQDKGEATQGWGWRRDVEHGCSLTRTWITSSCSPDFLPSPDRIPN